MFEEWREASQEVQDLNVIPVMNLFMVLIPFLLMGAAFLHVSVIPTSTPSHEPGAPAPEDPPTRVTANLRVEKDTIALTFSGAGVPDDVAADLGAQWPINDDGTYPVAKVQQHLRDIKKEYPKSNTVVVLPYDGLNYQRLVGILDKTREYKAGKTAAGDTKYEELFPVTVFSRLIKEEETAASETEAP
jgi:biopolymer transport protein ExbD